MSTAPLTEHDAFNAYIEHRWGGTLNGTSLEEALLEFRAYQRELVDARQKISDAIQSAENGEAQPLDTPRLQAIFERCDAKLNGMGIAE